MPIVSSISGDEITAGNKSLFLSTVIQEVDPECRVLFLCAGLMDLRCHLLVTTAGDPLPIVVAVEGHPSFCNMVVQSRMLPSSVALKLFESSHFSRRLS